MKLKLLLLILLSNLFSFGQKTKYKTISNSVISFVFNKEKDKVYFVKREYYESGPAKEFLYVYNTQTESSKHIELANNDKCIKNIYLTEDDLIIVHTCDYIYKIKDDKYIENIPIWDLGHPSPSEEDISILNNILSIPNIRFEKMEEFYLVIPPASANIEGAAFRDFKLKIADKELAEKAKRIMKTNELIQNNDYNYTKISEKYSINHFKNSNITLKEKFYFCNHLAPSSIFGFSDPPCWGKIKIITQEKSVVLKRRRWSSENFMEISESNFLCDKNGRIYLLFVDGEYDNVFSLISISTALRKN